MRVLVTGGTGFVGQAVVRELCALGHAVRLLVRRAGSERARAAVDQYGVQLCQGDILADGSLPAACANMDGVAHLVGIIAEAGQQTFENVHARGTRNIVDAARAAGVRRLVHMSALGTRPGAAARYHQSKWSAEQSVRRSDMPWTIFRPSIIYGPGDRFVTLFARMSRFSPVLPLIGGGRNRLQPVRVEDVASCFAQALTHPHAVGQTYDLCGPTALTLRQVLDTIMRVTGRRRLQLPLPFSWMRLQAIVLEALFAGLFHRPPPLSRDQLLLLQEDNVGQAEPALEQFRLSPVPFEAGLAAFLKTPGESESPGHP